MILLFPSLIKFGGGKDYVEGKSEEGREERRQKAKEERDRFIPSCHMFYGQRCVDVRDDLPKVCSIKPIRNNCYINEQF